MFVEARALGYVYSFCLSYVPLLALTVALQACDDSGQHAVYTVDEQSQKNHKRGADAAWEQLMAPGVMAGGAGDDSPITLFLREVELANQYRREHGLEFWRHYPDDPRRFEWLMLTIHLPPLYPKDIIDWSNEEASSLLRENASPIDLKEHTRWVEVYPELRREFWDSEHVSDVQRRYLWYGEILHSLDLLAFSPDQKGSEPQEATLRAVVDFVNAYPEAFSDLDRGTHSWMIRSLVGAVLSSNSMLRMDVSARIGFRQSLFDSSPEVSEAIQADSWSEFIDQTSGRYAHAPTTTQTPRGVIGGDILYLAGVPSSENSAGLYVFRKKTEIVRRKYRAFGMDLWQEATSITESDDSMDLYLDWVTRTLDAPPTYYSPLLDGLRASVILDLTDPDVSFADYTDLELSSSWNAWYADRRETILQHTDVSADYVARLLYFEARYALGQARLKLVPEERFQEWVEGALRKIHELYEIRSSFDSGSFATYVSMQRLVSTVLANSSSLRLSDDVVMQFLKPMLDYDDDIAKIAQNWLESYYRLREEPLHLELPTLEGERFSLSEFEGNAVLISIWSTTCASCIAAFPRIKAVYDRNKHLGFEVLSIGLDATSRRKRVDRIHKELNITWTALDGEGADAMLMRKFGIIGVPYYVLLDRRGILYADSQALDSGRNLEVLLKEMLADEAPDKAAAIH